MSKRFVFGCSQSWSTFRNKKRSRTDDEFISQSSKWFADVKIVEDNESTHASDEGNQMTSESISNQGSFEKSIQPDKIPGEIDLCNDNNLKSPLVRQKTNFPSVCRGIKQFQIFTCTV